MNRYEFMQASTDESWVAFDSQYKPSELLERILRADAHFIDLDDTLAPCQATKIITHNALRGQHRELDLMELVLRAKDLIGMCDEDKEVTKEEHWRWYLDTQLQTYSRAWERMIDEFRPQFVQERLYDGAFEVHTTNKRDQKKTDRYLVTRNHPVVAWAFAQQMGFTDYAAPAFNKFRAVRYILGQRLIQGNNTKTAVVFGNSLRDLDMIYSLQKQKVKVIGVYVTNNVCQEERVARNFQVQISRHNQRLLADYLEGQQYAVNTDRLVEASK